MVGGDEVASGSGFFDDAEWVFEEGVVFGFEAVQDFFGYGFGFEAHAAGRKALFLMFSKTLLAIYIIAGNFSKGLKVGFGTTCSAWLWVFSS